MPRQDAFTFVHKGIRTLIYRMSNTMQSADFSDLAAIPPIAAELDHGLELLAEHGAHEDRFLFPRLSQQEPDLVSTADGHHKEIHRRIDSLHPALRSIADEPDAACRVDEGERLNREFNDLFAFYLSHLCFEENQLLPVSFRALSDEDVVEIRTAIQRSMPAERYAEFLKLMFAGANNPELIFLLGGVKAAAPPAVVERLVHLIGQVLPSSRMQLLRERAGV